MGNKRWYVLRVISGKERKIKQYIELEIERNKIQDIVSNILVPTEKVYKIRNGKKVIKERNLFPGYMYVEADEKRFNGDIIKLISDVPNVINFIGGKTPQYISNAEAQKLLGKVDEMQDVDEEILEPFIVNESVKIVDGPFNDFIGTIEEILEDKKKLKVIVKIFGRRTPVEVNYVQVEKVS